jgi:prepilin-type N-terminal cleavage/methylation domain-containing protein
MMEMNMKANRKGFTMVELLVVLLFIGVIVTMSASISRQTSHRWALRGTAREITSLFYQAKQLASRENSLVMIDFTEDEYVLLQSRNNLWERFKGGRYGEKITVSKTPVDQTGFAISPSGILLNPDTKAIYGMQTIEVKSPHGANFDYIRITIYPYGGIRVQTDFR